MVSPEGGITRVVGPGVVVRRLVPVFPGLSWGGGTLALGSSPLWRRVRLALALRLRPRKDLIQGWVSGHTSATCPVSLHVVQQSFEASVVHSLAWCPKSAQLKQPRLAGRAWSYSSPASIADSLDFGVGVRDRLLVLWAISMPLLRNFLASSSREMESHIRSVGMTRSV